MAKKSKNRNWLESYPNLILGIIIVVILGVLIGNFLGKRNEQIGNGQQTTNSQEQGETASQQHKVEANESLSKIAEKYYGSIDYWPVLSRINNIKNPNLIFVEATINIPSKEEADRIKGEMTQTSYQVQKDDTLFTISQKMYGIGSKWPTIARTNNVGRLPNGNPLIFEGSTLKIPR